MKVLGIIAEYNPLHQGHIYHLQQSKKQAEPDYTVVILGSDFTQRGEPSVFSKWKRAEFAVKAGADLVIQLPQVYTFSNAEYFAKGAVDILKGLGCVTHLSFGSESEDLETLKAVAHLLANESSEFKNALSEAMDSGVSYPRARAEACAKVLGSKAETVLGNSNDILGIEYLKQLTGTETITPLIIKRKGDNYNQRTPLSGYPSATAIRALLRKENSKFQEEFKAFLPPFVLENVKDITSPDENLFFSLITGKVLVSKAEELKDIYSVTEGLENKVKEEVFRAENLDSYVNLLVSKRYTRTRIQRLLAHLLFNFKRQDFKTITQTEGTYGRVLAFNHAGADLIKKLKKSDSLSIPLITNLNKEIKNPELKKSRLCLEYDLISANLYNLLAGLDLYQNSDMKKHPEIL